MKSTTLYWENHKLMEDQCLEDGFYDPGGVVIDLRTNDVECHPHPPHV
jgi:hypothetical protein